MERVTQTVYVSEHPIALRCNSCGLRQVKSIQCPHEDGQLIPEVSMERAIVAYKIVIAPEYYNVADAVRQAMEEGWQPFGGVSVSIAHNPDRSPDDRFLIHVAQAMVKYAD